MVERDWSSDVYSSDLLGFGDIVHPVVNDEFETLVAEHGASEFRKVLLGKLDHRGVDLDLGEALDGLVLEHLLRDSAVTAACSKEATGTPSTGRTSATSGVP